MGRVAKMEDGGEGMEEYASMESSLGEGYDGVMMV